MEECNHVRRELTGTVACMCGTSPELACLGRALLALQAEAVVPGVVSRPLQDATVRSCFGTLGLRRSRVGDLTNRQVVT